MLESAFVPSPASALSIERACGHLHDTGGAIREIGPVSILLGSGAFATLCTLLLLLVLATFAPALGIIVNGIDIVMSLSLGQMFPLGLVG